MKKLNLVTLILFLMVIAASGADLKKNYIGANLGIFNPAGDISEYDTGTNFGIYYQRKFSDFLGLRFEISGHNTEYNYSIYGYDAKDEINTTAFETSVILQNTYQKFTPYVGLGFGSYVNEIKISLDGDEVYSDTGTALGVVIQAGLLFDITNNFYIGGNFKIFTNNQEIEYTSETLQLGGYKTNIEAGFKF
ncbi:porin family protein [Deferribacteraceae bacterium V6Fe1]|nr:porin family protein [Deferribacteraceae bacterium V6Fe1]